MSAVGRLARRAPWWRLTVVTAASFALLAWLYPDPALLALLRRSGAPLVGTPKPSPAIEVTPSLEAVVAGTMRLGGGHILPLPAGPWHEIVALRDEVPTEFNVVSLARIEHGALTGLIAALTTVDPVTGPFGPGHTGPGLPFGCFDARSLATGPPAADGSAPRDCWYAHAGTLASLDPPTAHRLSELGIAVPPVMTAMDWTRVERGDLERVTIMLPGNGPAQLASRSTWMRAWRGLLRRGFDGHLTPADIPDRVAHEAR